MLHEYNRTKVTILKDDLYSAIECIENGIENTIEVLNDHDNRFGRTTKSNLRKAELYEIEIRNMRDILKTLKNIKV
jgi:hypothetical protein